jgi:drug/metabolite transporter (DMT)-like permease
MFSLNSIFILFAAFLWATDSLFRYPLISKGLSSVSVVFTEHLIVLIVLLIYISFKKIKLFGLSKKQWLSLFFIGVFSSALATVLFTLSFKYGNPSVSILLQKLQPIVVILLSLIILKEKPHRNFYVYAAVALVAGLFLSFPNLNFNFLNHPSGYWNSALLALSAAVLWGIGTVVGKSASFDTPETVLIFWRYLFGAIAVFVISLFQKQSLFSEVMYQYENLFPLLYMALVVGLLSMVSYYRGLRKVLATQATILELIFPVSAVALNFIFLDQKLSAIQIIAAVVLLTVITQISRLKMSCELK